MLNECTPKTLLAMAEQVSSIHIREISFTVPTFKAYWQDISYMSALDTVLQRPNFAQLEAVKIDQQEGPDALSSDGGWIQDRLPLLAARGIVRHKMILMFA